MPDGISQRPVIGGERQFRIQELFDRPAEHRVRGSELLATVREADVGPQWFQRATGILRRGVLRAGEAVHAVPAGTAELARHHHWTQVAGVVRDHNDAASGARTLSFAASGSGAGGGGASIDTRALAFAASIPGDPSTPLTPAQHSLYLGQATGVGIPADHVEVALQMRAAGTLSGGEVAVPSAASGAAAGTPDRLRHMLADGFDQIALLPEPHQREVLVDIVGQLGNADAGMLSSDELVRLLAETPAEEAAPAMQRGMEQFAARYPDGLASVAEVVEQARTAVQQAPEIRPVADAAISSTPKFFMRFDDAVEAAVRLLR